MKRIAIIAVLLGLIQSCNSNKSADVYHKVDLSEFSFLPESKLIVGGRFEKIQEFNLKKEEDDEYGSLMNDGSLGFDVYNGLTYFEIDGIFYLARVELWVENGQIFNTIFQIPAEKELLYKIIDKLSVRFSIEEIPENEVFVFDDEKFNIWMRHRENDVFLGERTSLVTLELTAKEK